MTDESQMSGVTQAGLGDAAYIVRSNSLVAVLKGTTRVFVTRSNPLTDQAAVDQLVALAGTIVANL